MTAIAAIQTHKISLLVTDKLGTLGSFKEHNVQKVFYGDNYIIAFAGALTPEFLDYVKKNINDIAENNITSEDIIKAIKADWVIINSKVIDNISCICIKNGIMSYARYSLNGMSFTQENQFIGMGTGGSELASALSMAFDDQDIDSLSEDEIKLKAQKAMLYVSNMKAGVGTDALVYTQKKNNSTVDANDNTFTTIEFSDNIQGNRKKISAIVASSAICHDGYELSPKLLIKLSDDINKMPITMRLIPNGSEHHNQDEVIGEWIGAKATTLGNITLLKSCGYVDNSLQINQNLSTSILCKPTEISLRKNVNGGYIKSVTNAELIDISITTSPLDKFCAVLEASSEFDEELGGSDIIINQCTINFTDNDFDNLLNKTMNTNSIEETSVCDAKLQSDAIKEDKAVIQCTNDIVEERVEEIAIVQDTPSDNVQNEGEKLNYQNIQEENSQLKAQIQDYENVVGKLLDERKAQEDDIKTYDAILNNPQILEQIIKHKK